MPYALPCQPRALVCVPPFLIISHRSFATHSQARKLFSSDDEALAFMKEHDFNEARVHFLVKINRKAEAANVLLEMGREPEGYRLMVQDYENVSSMRRVSDYILDKLWQYLSLGFVPKRNQTLQAVADLLHLATLLNQALLDPKDCDEVCRTTFSPDRH